MVGVPRSTGCQLCRKRRVKCDEAKPACGNCIKYGTECPGYTRTIKFISGKHQVRPKRNRSAENASPSTSTSTSTNLKSRTPPSDASSWSSFTAEPAPNRGEFISTMVETARNAIEQRNSVSFFSWVKFGKLGTTVSLDGALCSLTMHLIGKQGSDENMLSQSRTMYGQALNSLQMSLMHPTRWKASETLCTAILLCIYELFAGTGSSDSWLQHARGVGVLMEQRGPKAHKAGWDAAMLLSFRGILIMADLFFPRGEECFLARPEWNAVMRDNGRRLLYPPDFSLDLDEAIDEYLARQADIPKVVRLSYPLLEAARHGQALDRTHVAAARAVTAVSHAKMVEWWERYKHNFPEPVSVPTQDPGSIYTTALQYNSAWLASLQLSYYATLCLLQAFLTVQGWPFNFEESQRDHVQLILRSVESVGAGPIGPYRVGYALRIAYELANAEAQEWIRKTLDQFKERYAATDKMTYPKSRTDLLGYA